jgi:hypothetical protein
MLRGCRCERSSRFHRPDQEGKKAAAEESDSGQDKRPRVTRLRFISFASGNAVNIGNPERPDPYLDAD